MLQLTQPAGLNLQITSPLSPRKTRRRLSKTLRVKNANFHADYIIPPKCEFPALKKLTQQIKC